MGRDEEIVSISEKDYSIMSAMISLSKIRIELQWSSKTKKYKINGDETKTETEFIKTVDVEISPEFMTPEGVECREGIDTISYENIYAIVDDNIFSRHVPLVALKAYQLMKKKAMVKATIIADRKNKCTNSTIVGTIRAISDSNVLFRTETVKGGGAEIDAYFGDIVRMEDVGKNYEF
jgi:hypothetical protein